MSKFCYGANLNELTPYIRGHERMASGPNEALTLTENALLVKTTWSGSLKGHSDGSMWPILFQALLPAAP